MLKVVSGAMSFKTVFILGVIMLFIPIQLKIKDSLNS